MSEQQLSAFLEKLKDNADLRDMLNAATDLDSAVAIAREEGFDVTQEDFQDFRDGSKSQLSDLELEQAVGASKINILSVLGTLALGCCAEKFDVTAQKNNKIPYMC